VKDIRLYNGETMTDAEFIKERGLGDTPTNFLATRADLESLANRLVDGLLAHEFTLNLQVCHIQLARWEYCRFRLNRVMVFLPELEDEMQGKLRRGYEKNKVDAEKVVAEWDADAAKEKNAG
jgi:hypothetical protein